MHEFRSIPTIRLRLALPLVLLALAGCAANVLSSPASLSPAPELSSSPVLVAREEADITLPTQYTRRIPMHSRWRLVGHLPEGDVYRPVDTVFTIEGRQVHEAYLVVSGGNLVGFYLPGEKRYSALNSRIPLNLGEAQ
ncbi:hypothetical protein CAL26_18270 [Bordetella genomosp. 9]|uniref:Lipoprotein n=2 Tax=Bordetella genomosp. 9 TaxID=1416803 RepID=A0A261R478_9BORD|nr:hypothetical protein CAL26_18270 [Bordetella genomosp. 9]